LVWTFRTRNTPFLPAGIVTPDIPKLTKVGVKAKGTGKGKGHPRRGHELPEGE